MNDNINSDELKGRAKQAVGDLTNDDELKAEGERDEAAGKAKEFVEDVADKANEAINKLRGND